MKKIVFTGPESAGKTTLAEKLAHRFSIPHVKEVAREYLTNLNRPYNYEDVLNISMLQLAEEEKIKSLNPPLLICDTDLATIKIWCDDKFNQCEPWITSAYLERLPDIYFLCVPDFPWQPDPMREDATRRDHLYEVHKAFLIHHKLRFIELSGDVETRLQTIFAALES